MKLNKIISCIIALSMIISMFSMVTVSAATLEGLTLLYEFTNDKDGDADGTITISGITSEMQTAITNINLYWGKSANEPMDSYYNIANYTVDGFTYANADYDATKLDYTDGSISYPFTNGRLIPEGATHVIADIITTDADTAETTTTQLSYKIPEGKLIKADKAKMLYNMVWSSDFHAENVAVMENSHERKGITDYVRLAEMGREIGEDKFKGVIFNGDISNSSIDYEYAIIEQLFEEHGIDNNFPVYYTTGNHDTAVTVNNVIYDISTEAKKALAVRFDKLEKQFGLTFDHSDPWSYETYIGGHHYIFLSTPYVNEYSLTSSQAKWLEEKLSYDEKSGIPTFIFTHLPWKDSGLTRLGGAFNGYAAFTAAMERHPSAIVITSHVHMEPDSDQITYNIAEAGNTPVIDTGAVTYTNATTSEGKTASGRGGYSKYVEVYPDRIIMRTRNHKTQKWVAKAEHIIYIDNYGTTIEEDFSIASEGEGVIVAGETLTAKLGGADITDGYTVEWFDMSGASLGTGAAYTVAAADASVSAKITRAADGAYAWAVARHGSWVSEFDDGTSDDEGTTSIPADGLTYDSNISVKYYGDIVYMYGSVDSSYAGEEATMVLMSKGDYPDMSKAKYFGYCTIASDGSYMFKFKASDVAVGDIMLIKAGDAEIVANDVSQKGALEDIVEVTAVINDDNTVSITTKNVYADAMNAKVILAMYDYPSGKLSKTKISDYALAFSENGELQSWVSEAVDGGKTIKVFLWTNLTDIVPLSGEKDLGVSAVITTETAEETTTEVTE